MAGKHETIADELTEDILSLRCRAGERLPSERDLAARFETNRGAVREAMKRLEQLGLVSIQPGGTRVNPIQQASLDVVGHLMARGKLPDEQLVDQTLTVISSLVAIAAEGAVKNGSPEDIESLRALIQPLTKPGLDAQAHEAARFNLMQAIMATSGNLICQLIARSLLEQFVPNMEPLRRYAVQLLDLGAYTVYAKQLDTALAARDIPAVKATFEAFSQLNRTHVMQAFELAQSMPAGSNNRPMNDLSNGSAEDADTKVAAS
jgi:DNA-binding FadR family transcriptional regulator